MRLLLLLPALLLLLNPVQSCQYSKDATLQCLLRHDLNNDKFISESEIKKVMDEKMSWFEKLVYSPTRVVNLFKADCGLPMGASEMLKESCFKSCFYRDNLVNKVCS